MGRGRSQKTLDLVNQAREILEEIQPASVRAVSYQLFVRGLIASMAKVSTNRVGSILTRAREEGEIPWAWIVQEGRPIEAIATWQDPAAFARAVQASYRRDKWQGQPKRIIVVSEKGTVRGTLGPVLNEFEIEFLPVGGYASATRVHELAEASSDKGMLLLYLGDHDPSGRHMSDEDLPQRLARYSDDREAIEVRRIALTAPDTEALGRTLGFPATDKRADTRYQWFVRNHGRRCWELDAMNPNVLRDRVRAAILAEIDAAHWDRYVAAEEAERVSIVQTLSTWKSISGLARE
jgi:hypothetical protein